MTDRIIEKLRKFWILPALAALVALAIFWVFPFESGHARAAPMPEFTATSPDLWVNSPPLRKADLRGKVVLLEIWTSI